jgi:SOS-response transcriptional repressor LexA
MEIRPLTEKQRAMLDAIVELTGAYGKPPSLDELKDSCGYASTQAVRNHLAALVKKGVLHQPRRNARRDLRPTPQALAALAS